MGLNLQDHSVVGLRVGVAISGIMNGIDAMALGSSPITITTFGSKVVGQCQEQYLENILSSHHAAETSETIS